MKTRSGRSRVTRLIQIVLAMQGGRFPNVDDLARFCEVTRRTIFRDLECLEDAGVAFVYDPDRQGYRFDLRTTLDPPRLEEQELSALVVLVEQWGKAEASGLLRQARSGVGKLLQKAPGLVRGRLVELGDAVWNESWPLDRSRERAEVYETLVEGLTRRLQLRCWFREEAGAEAQCTRLSPYRLLVGGASWTVVGRSQWHRRIVAMEAPLIERLELTEEAFELPPRLPIERYTNAPGHGPWDVRLRFKAEAVPWVLDAVWHRSQSIRRREDGGLDFEATVPRFDDVLTWVVGFGDRVEVLGPPELRETLRELGTAYVRAYTTQPPESEGFPANGVAKGVAGALAFGADGVAHAPG